MRALPLQLQPSLLRRSGALALAGDLPFAAGLGGEVRHGSYFFASR
jgi:hypothetical protein